MPQSVFALLSLMMIVAVNAAAPSRNSTIPGNWRQCWAGDPAKEPSKFSILSKYCSTFFGLEHGEAASIGVFLSGSALYPAGYTPSSECKVGPVWSSHKRLVTGWIASSWLSGQWLQPALHRR